MVPGSLAKIEALQAWSGGAAVRLMDFSIDLGALLLERLTPRRTLASLDHDEHATRVAAQIMRELWQPPPSNSAFPTTAQWADGLRRLRTRFDGGTGPFPRALVEIAELLFRELLASSEAPVLLHGDLHHFNILSSDRRPWVAIDPKGLSGEPLTKLARCYVTRMPGFRQMSGFSAGALVSPR